MKMTSCACRTTLDDSLFVYLRMGVIKLSSLRLYVFIFLGCIFSLEASSKMSNMNSSDTTELEGVILKMTEVNPPGSKIKSNTDFYIQASLKSYFIKLCESSVSKDQLAELVGMQVKAKLNVRDGFWDMCGDAIVQSRTGPYAALHSIQILKDKKTYNYFDGNGNHYTVTLGMIKYDPVRKENSSSGMYSGGKPARAAITQEQFESILKQIDSIEKDATIRHNNREKGTGMISISFSQELRKFIFLKGQKMDELEKTLKDILGNSK